MVTTGGACANAGVAMPAAANASASRRVGAARVMPPYVGRRAPASTLDPAMPDASAAAAPLRLADVRLTLPSAAGPVEILRGVDFECAPGERVAVIGPSGCGKSSLIAVAAGLERPTRGAVSLFGEDLGRSARIVARCCGAGGSRWCSNPFTSCRT